MVRGLMAGLGTGGLVAVLGLGALSVLAPLPTGPAANLPQRPAEAPAPVRPAPPAVVVAPAPVAKPPAAKPVVAPTPEAAHAAAPAPETKPLVTQVPEVRQPAAPEAPARSAPDAVSVPAASEFARGAGDRAPAAPQAEAAPVATAAPVAPSEPAVTMPLVAAAPAPAARPEAPQAPLVPPVPEAAPEAPVDGPAAEAPVPVPPPGEALSPGLSPAGREIVLMPNAPSGPGPRIFAPGQGAPGTVVNRLPAIGSEPLPQIEPAPAAAPAGPHLSIVLIDVGTAAGGLDRAAIKALGLPLTVAIDPTQPDAADAAAEYHAAGLEVAILAVGLPTGATAQDAEVALEAWRRAVPEAVAVVEPPQPAFQNNRLLAQAMVPALAREGLALVTQAGTGTNAAAQIARADGLPEASVWKVLDAGRGSEAEIGRALDRAAAEAGRNEGAVVMLHAWPASVMGLREWAEEGAKAAPAPVSSQLRD